MLFSAILSAFFIFRTIVLKTNKNFLLKHQKQMRMDHPSYFYEDNLKS